MATAFVLMPFDDDFKVLYTSFIQPVLEQCGFVVEQAGDIENNRNILRDIISGINNSDLVVADLTGNNPNVLYELGLAHALEKPVITSHSSDRRGAFRLEVLPYVRVQPGFQ